jgi:hypothetical protein
VSRGGHSADVSADVALDDQSAAIHIVETRTLDLDDLFRDIHDDAPADV